MTRFIGLLACLLVSIACAQTPSFDTRTNILRIPSLQVDSGGIISNVQIMLPPAGAWSLFGMGQIRSASSAASNTYPLVTTITNFTGSLNTSSLFTLANEQLWTGCEATSGVAGVPLSSNVTIYRTGESAYLMTFAGSAVTCTPTPFVQYGESASVGDFVVQPESLSGSVLQTLNFVVVGGTPPYQAVSSNTTIAPVGALTLTSGLARATGTVNLTSTAGEASIVITDATGRILMLPVTSIGSTSAVPLSIAPPTVEAQRGDQITLSVAGGSLPYEITSSLPFIVTVRSITQDQNANRAVAILDVVGLSGTVAVNVADRAGNTASTVITVIPPLPGPVSTTPLASSPDTLVAQYGNQPALTISGGALPYSVTSSNNAIVQVMAKTESTIAASATVNLYISGRSGNAAINVADATGTSITIPVTVQPGPTSTFPLTASPAVLAAHYGNRAALTISGGALPYVVTSSNNSVVAILSKSESTVTASATVTLYITGRSGSAAIGVSDAAGAAISVPVTVD